MPRRVRTLAACGAGDGLTEVPQLRARYLATSCHCHCNSSLLAFGAWAVFGLKPRIAFGQLARHRASVCWSWRPQFRMHGVGGSASAHGTDRNETGTHADIAQGPRGSRGSRSDEEVVLRLAASVAGQRAPSCCSIVAAGVERGLTVAPMLQFELSNCQRYYRGPPSTLGQCSFLGEEGIGSSSLELDTEGRCQDDATTNSLVLQGEAASAVQVMLRRKR